MWHGSLNALMVLSLVGAFSLGGILFDAAPGEQASRDFATAGLAVLTIVLGLIAWPSSPRWARAVQMSACVFALAPLAWALL